MADTANRNRGSGRRVRGAFAPEARCGYRNPTLSSILATQMPCRSRRSGAQAVRRELCGVAFTLKMMHSTAPRIIQTFIESNDLTEKTCTRSAPPAAAVMTKACGTCNPCTRISILPPKASPHGWTVLPECSPFPYNLNAKPPTQFCCAGGFVLCLAFLQGCVYNNRAVVLLHRAQLPDSNCLSSSVG